MVVAAACGDGAPEAARSTAPATPASTAGTTATAATTSTTLPPAASTTTTMAGPAVDVPPELADFPLTTMLVAGEEWLVAVADNDQRRAQGLMRVRSLGDLDGMLFDFDGYSTTGFWMFETYLPLEVAFFGPEGYLQEVISMVPCESDDCPTYRPGAPYRWALEAPPGRLTALPPGARITAG